MNKKLILIAVTLLLSLNIAACSADKNTTEKEQDSDIENKKEETEQGKDEEKDKNTESNEPEYKNEIENKEKVEYELNAEGIIKPEDAEKIIKEKSDLLIYAISNKDAETISKFVHPVKGVRFTPYTNVSLEKDIVFSKEQMSNFFKDQELYSWGYYDGRGDEISLTPDKYYDTFIYSEDFINAEKIGYNEVLSSGNITENQFESYDNPIVVEYYFSGFNPDYGGADWQSLRLVFEEHEHEWKLVGIIHNQWTI